MIPQFVLIDTTDGFTIWRDQGGKMLREDSARWMRDLYNLERKPEAPRWVIAKVEVVE